MECFGRATQWLSLALDLIGPLAAGYFGTERKPGVVAVNRQEIALIQKKDDNSFTAQPVATLPIVVEEISKRRPHFIQPLVVDLDRDLSDEVVFSFEDGKIYVSDLDNLEPSPISLHERANLGEGSKVQPLARVFCYGGIQRAE